MKRTPGSLALLALLVSLPAARATAAVEAGPIVNPANGHAYYLLTQTTWAAAEAEAQTLGGHLVAIGDGDENTWVWETFAGIAGGPFWIGLTDEAQEGSFVWTSGEPFGYSNWWTAGGEPNNAGGVEHYVEINNYVWNDNAGTAPFRAVVEVEPGFVFVEAEPIPPPPPSALEQASLMGIQVSSDGRHVYALYGVAIGDDRVLVYERGTDGALDLVDQPVVTANPNAMALAPDGSALFVVGNNGELQAWRRAPATGLLTFADQVFDGGEGGNHLQFALGVAVSPDGENVYVAGQENAVTSFAWDGGAGTLTLVDTDVTGTGDLVLSSPGPLAVTPDGAFVLVLSLFDHALVVLARDPGTGALSFVDRFVDGTGGVDGLFSPYAIATAATTQGASAYVSGRPEGKLARFAEGLSGMSLGVSFVEAVTVGSFPASLAVAPDGTRLYVTDTILDRVAAYERDPATGAIGALVDEIADGDPGVEGLASPEHVAVSPDGRNVYAASSTDDTIAVLLAPEPGAAGAGLAALLALAGISRRRRRRCGTGTGARARPDPDSRRRRAT